MAAISRICVDWTLWGEFHDRYDPSAVRKRSLPLMAFTAGNAHHTCRVCLFTLFHFVEMESCLISHIRIRVEIHQEAGTDPSSPLPGEWIGDASFSPGEAGNGIYFSKSVAISPKREPSPLDSPPADGACSMMRSAMREKGMLWR
ncbi:hypothetical protein MSL71_29790 [Desulfoluna butyratoxydans]|uniref:Uncharacterized protein n=1 Tax=Desulfoluna butyratoxydans TaxID=231438 RepID=A0A4U8YTX1_9BACT|nr:hypothetical protein MSL71_29790 [Desulfoluna butyratoxydans]